MMPLSEAAKRALCSFLPLAVTLAGCATRARLPTAASLGEREFYDACAGASADAGGVASLYCACAARVFHETWPGDQPAPDSEQKLSPTDGPGAETDCLYSKDGVLVSCRDSWQQRLNAAPGRGPVPAATNSVDVGREAGAACRPFVDATVNQCMVSLTAVEPAERADACDCVLRSLAEEFSPAELVTMGRNQAAAVPNAQGRVDAAYRRCVPSSDSSDDWALALSITSAILGAGALALGIATATSTPDTNYYFLPSN